jgi:dTDP-4-dehydrorhamnose reductase
MRMIVTGRTGQVVRALQAIGPRMGVEVVSLGRPTLDLADANSIVPALLATKPDVIVNAAAYTAVDKAENEPDLVQAINAHGAGVVARAASEAQVPVLQISTDYVFDGMADRPYLEDDPTGPLGVYGRTKLEGEQAVAFVNPLHVILRTAWIYSPFGQNFVRTMLQLAATRDEVSVVADQHGCPTSAIDIGHAIIAVAKRIVGEKDCSAPTFGTFHLTGQGQAVWADVAEAVFSRSAKLGGPRANVSRIRTEAYPTPARRPANSRLDGGKLESIYGIVLPAWRDSLDACVTSLLATASSVTGGAPVAK